MYSYWSLRVKWDPLLFLGLLYAHFHKCECLQVGQQGLNFKNITVTLLGFLMQIYFKRQKGQHNKNKDSFNLLVFLNLKIIHYQALTP